MFSVDEDLPKKIKTEAGALIDELCAAGWAVSASRYDAKSFGNWYVDLSYTSHTIRLIEDRLQYVVDGPPIEILKSAGLWRSFDDFEEFRSAVIKWATTQGSVI